jgi:hypothetical protein
MIQNPGAFTPFNNNPLPKLPLRLSKQAGLHPALLEFDITQANGVNVGFNPTTTVDSSKKQSFYWYAGELSIRPNRSGIGKDLGYHVVPVPIEYGAINLVPADLLVQPQFGMVGALIVEPENSKWVEDQGTRASATVTPDKGRPFRDFILLSQNMVANTGRSGWGAINYRTETFRSRGLDKISNDFGQAKAFSNDQLMPAQDPETPVFRAAAATPVRFRLLMPSTSTMFGLQTPVTFTIHGHGWEEEPYTDRGTRLGRNIRSAFLGAQQVAPYEAFNLLIDRAGGPFAVPGDYLYEGLQRTSVQGLWGLFRVEEDLLAINEVSLDKGKLVLKGIHIASARNTRKPYTISVSIKKDGSDPMPLKGTSDVGKPGEIKWSFTADYDKKDKLGPGVIIVACSLGGKTTVRLSQEKAK